MEIWAALLIAFVSIVIGGLLTWVIGKALGAIQQTELLKKLRDAVIDREHVSVNEEFLMTQLLAEKILNDNFIPDVIFAVCPGGAMIAEWLSRRFFKKRSVSIPVQSLYMVIQETKEEGMRKIEANVDDKLAVISSGLPKNSKVLLVNDISRSGHTLDAAYGFLRNHFQEGSIRSATLIYHKDTTVIPKYYVALTEKTIRFDWKSYDQ